MTAGDREEKAMATTETVPAAAAGPPERWYALSAEEVAARSGVDPASGLPVAKAAELLQRGGPNALPAEKGVPGWRRFLDQYRAYMQIILLIAAAVSLVIGQWSTGLVLIALTVFNAVTGASAYQARSVTGTALTGETFDNRHLNWTVLAEVVLAVLITQMDVMRRIFGTERLTAGRRRVGARSPAAAREVNAQSPAAPRLRT